MRSSKMEKTDARDFKDRVLKMRSTLEGLKSSVHGLKRHNVFENRLNPDEDHGEMKANIMLTFRHLEDARMRLGKVIQALEGGISIFDKES